MCMLGEGGRVRGGEVERLGRCEEGGREGGRLRRHWVRVRIAFIFGEDLRR